MPVEANVKHAHHLEYYSEFATFADADAHLVGEGWRLTKYKYSTNRWEYTKDNEVLILKEVE